MKELTVKATVDNIPVVTDFVNEELESMEASMKAIMQIDIAVDELFGNIARYAYSEHSEPGDAKVSIEFEEEAKEVTITFADYGVPYNPLAKADPDVTLSAEDRAVGGLGIFLVKKTMDDMKYRYESGQNILSIIKRV